MKNQGDKCAVTCLPRTVTAPLFHACACICKPCHAPVQGAEGHPPNVSILPSPRRRRGEIHSAPSPPPARTALHSFAPPLPTKTASLGFRGGPNRARGKAAHKNPPSFVPCLSSFVPPQGVGVAQGGARSPLKGGGRNGAGGVVAAGGDAAERNFFRRAWRFDGTAPMTSFHLCDL